MTRRHDDAEIPGGCDSCNAHQTISPLTERIWSLTLHHTEGCPADAAAPPMTPRKDPR